MPESCPQYVTYSQPAMRGIWQSRSGLYPTFSREERLPRRMSIPSTFAVPELGVSRFRRHLISVVFPAPFGPSSPIAPGGTCRLTSDKAR
jgi:hypothetical protein